MKKLLVTSLMSLLVLSVFLGFKEWGNPFQIMKDTRPIVNIGRLICGGHLPLAVAEKLYQSDMQLFRLNTVQNHQWSNVIADMKSGKLSGTFILSPLAMQLIKEGFPGKIVLKADRNGNGFVLSHAIKQIDDLKTTKAVLAVPHIYSQHHVLLQMLLKQHQIPAEMTTIVAMPPRDMILSLQRGEIDGFMVGEPEGLRAISLNAGWMAAISPDIWKDHMDHVFMATNDFILQHPEQVQELISLLKRAGQYIEQNPHESAVMGEDYTGAPAAVFEQVLTTPEDWIDYTDMIPSESDIKSMAEKLVEMGLWSEMPEDLQLFIDTRFITAQM